MENITLPKIIAVGIYNARLGAKNRAVTKNRKTTMFELELPIGDGGATYIGSRSHPINERTLICAKPGQIRHTRLPFKCYYIHFIVNEGELYRSLMDTSSFVEMESVDRVKEIFDKLIPLFNDFLPENELLLHSLVMELVYIFHKNSKESDARLYSAGSNQRVIDQTIEYISENLTKDLSLSALSQRASFTETYFHKLFKSSTGKTLREYVEDMRIKEAIRLMISTDMTLTQIAYECGFSSQAYFNYAFKRKMSSPPREYIKSLHKKYEE